MKVIFKGITTENVVRGKSRYTKATVNYTYNGEARSQNIVSFSNPTIFKQVQELTPDTEIEVDIGKNDAGYNEWKSITVGVPVAATNSTSAAATVTRVSGSNYETKEERAARQVLIVKQSSLSAAVGTLSPGAKTALDPKTVLDLAQEYTDWVFSNDLEDFKEVA